MDDSSCCCCGHVLDEHESSFLQSCAVGDCDCVAFDLDEETL